MASYGAPAFLNQLAAQIVAEIQTAIEIKKFTNNTAIIGQYVEASVRQFIRKYLSPIRISTGGVIDQDQTPGGFIPQLEYDCVDTWTSGSNLRNRGFWTRAAQQLSRHSGN